MKRVITPSLMLLLVLPACTDDKDDTDSDTSASSTATATTTGGSSGVTTSDASTGDASTGDASTGDATTAEPTTADPTTTDATTTEGSTTGPSPTGMRFIDEIWPILQPNCGCHTVGPSGGLLLGMDADTAYNALVNMPSSINMNYVTPGDPDASYMFHKISGTQLEAGGGGASMPLGAPALSPADIATIEAWIVDGAN